MASFRKPMTTDIWSHEMNSYFWPWVRPQSGEAPKKLNYEFTQGKECACYRSV